MGAMTSITRWKLLSGLLVAQLAHSWWPQDVRRAPASGRLPKSGLPLRITAAQAGISLDDLVGKLLAARAVEDVRELAETLGAVGDDRAIDQLTPLLSDVRVGVPEAMLAAFGRIGTEHAVRIIAPRVRGARHDVKLAAIEALGATHNGDAEAPLIGIADDGSLDEQLRMTAIWSLGELGSRGSVAMLEQLAATGSPEIMQSSINAIARIDSPTGRDALERLIDSPTLDDARAALGAITVIDDELFAKLAAIPRCDRDRGEAHPLDRALRRRVGISRARAIRLTARRGSPHPHHTGSRAGYARAGASFADVRQGQACCRGRGACAARSGAVGAASSDRCAREYTQRHGTRRAARSDAEP